jgi:hypothetical protein
VTAPISGPNLIRTPVGKGISPHVDASLAGATLLVSLDTLAEGAGGETNFPPLGVKFRPTQGDALMWRSPAAERSCQSGQSPHEGLAVKSGVKHVLVAQFGALRGGEELGRVGETNGVGWNGRK